MKSYPVNSITCAALAIAVLSTLLAAISLYQIKLLSRNIEKVSIKTDFNHFFNGHAAQINEHIDVRIDAYIDRRKQEKIAKKYEGYELAAEKTRTRHHLYGNENARFTLIEYSDLECPFCKKFHSVLKKVIDSSLGLVNWQWKHLPLPIHNPMAAIEAEAAECVASIAGNRAFWVYLEQIFEETKGNGQGAGNLVSIAQNMGIDEQLVSDCINAQKFRDKVDTEFKQAKDLGIHSAPVTFIVDNQTGQNILLRGVQIPEAIVSTIQRMKKEADLSSNNHSIQE